MIKIKRALLSVSDKTGIVELAKNLRKYNYEIISTGGTKKVLEDAGVEVIEISEITGNPEAFGGRMKTISFNIESALLFDREKDKKEAEALKIDPIDMVVCNLYPFAKVKEQNANFETLIENIDIGGPTMLRAAAKNFKYVTSITDVNDYAKIIAELDENKGGIGYATRKNLMRKTFNHTADYDALIATTMDEFSEIRSLRFYFNEGKKLRYGENSHQKGYFYREMNNKNSLAEMEILHGKELSFNNIADIQSAIDAVKNLENFAVAVVKHNNSCGLASGENQRKVFEMAWNGDPISAFGSILAFNKKVDLETVEFLCLNDENKQNRKFVEVIIAPDFSAETLAYLQFHKNLRVIKFDPQKLKVQKDVKFLNGAILLQDADEELYSKMDCVTNRKIDVEKEKKLIEFGLIAMRMVKSNSIIIVRKLVDGTFQQIGMGAGQPNRLISTKLAIEKAKENFANEYKGEDLEKYFKEQFAKCFLISDAFFPFADNVEIVAKSGIKTIVQPGGSMRDKSVIHKCNELEIAMIFTGLRHFKH